MPKNIPRYILVDIVENALLDTNDMDVTFGDFAEAVVDALVKEDLVNLTPYDDEGNYNPDFDEDGDYHEIS